MTDPAPLVGDTLRRARDAILAQTGHVTLAELWAYAAPDLHRLMTLHPQVVARELAALWLYHDVRSHP